MTVKRKRLISAILTFVMVLSLTNVFPAGKSAYAAEQSNDTNQGNSYHYKQLTELGKKVYDGMVAMSKEDDFKAGTASYDLVTEGGLTADDVSSNTELNKAMYAARYAFYADHPEIFYVDFSKLALRTTQGNDGRKHVTIGSGRNANYLNEGLKDKTAVENAIAEFNDRVNEIVKGADAVTEPLNGSLQAAKVKYVHKEINENVAYRMEDSAYVTSEASPNEFQNMDNAPLLGTPYGVLVRKQGVCEGYARAFKAVMDKLGINCIQVQGAHQYSGEVAVGHMWNYVEITDSNPATSGAAKLRAAKAATGGKWYAVDATLDDPEFPVDTEDEIGAECQRYERTFDPNKLAEGATKYGMSGFEHEKYLLAGQLTMNQEHFANEEVAAADDYHFSYPVLEDNDFTVTNVTNDLDGFSVIKKDVVDSYSQQTTTEFQFNYLGMNAPKAAEKGIYLVWRYYRVENGEIVPVYQKDQQGKKCGSWFYIGEVVGYPPSEKGEYTCISEGETPYVEIAATTVPPEKNSNGSLIIGKSFVYQGSDSGLIARTGLLSNDHWDKYKYEAPPYIKRQTPTATSTISVSDRFFHITVEYDETLKKAEGKNVDETKITCYDRLGSEVTGAEHSKIQNFHWDGDKTVEFDMKFSTMFADDNVIYRIHLEGLVGKKSNKTPNPVVYTARQGTACPCVMKRDGNWNIFGKPTLLASDDLSTKGWTMSNGQAVSDRLKDRLTLVTTKTTAAQEKKMDQALASNNETKDDEIISKATYNITLSVCKSVVIPNGHKVQVRLGFPEGYGPDDEGVTFKAYHFMRDSQGNVTGVEEIPCVITQYGLILTCDAFSPFTIAAVKADPNETASTSKTLVVTTSDGGAAISDNWDNNTPGMVTLDDNTNSQKTLKFTPNEGYQIESITVCGETKEVPAGEDGSATVTVSYDQVKDAANNIVNANFVAKTVAQAEEEAGQTVVEPTVPEVTVTIPATKSCGANGTLSIVPESITEVTDGVQTYQWYKVAEDGTDTLLEGKVNRILEIPDVQNDVAGNYKLKVTTTVGTVSRVDTSNACEVTITECEHTETTTTPAKAATCTEQGNEEYVTCNACGALVSGSQKPLKTIAHNYVQDATANHLKEAATCSKSAVYYESCSMCHENGTATFAAGELAAHNYVETATENHLKSAATCSSPAVYYKSCSVCGQNRMTETFESGEVDPDNHGETEIRNATLATNTKDGYTGDTFCTVCNQQIANGETIPKETAATITMPEDQSVVAGGTLTIDPTVNEQSDYTQTFQWYKNDQKLDGQTNKTLTIENVAADHAGTYTLEVTTAIDGVEKAKSTSAGCEVTVMAQPTSATIEMPESQSVAVGEQLTITPTVSEQSGYTQTYQWFKDNEELSGKTDKILTIDKAALTDAGTYTLKVTTTIGNASAEATSNGCVVTVTEPEDPEKPVDPNNLTVNITDGKITKINGIPVPEDEGTITSGSYPFNTVLTVEPENAGAFTGWKMGDKYISYSQTYQFYVKTSMDITADSTVVEKKEPLVTFMQKTRDADDAGKQTVKLGISVDVPEGFEVVSEGIIRSYRAPRIEADDQNNTGLEIGKTGVTNQVSKKVFSQGSYTYSFTIAKNSANKTKPVYARGYVRYKASGSNEIQTVYTGIETLKPATAG